MRATKVADPELQAETLRIVQDAKMPVSVDYVASNLTVAWNTAAMILLELVLKGKVKRQKTTTSWIFSAAKEEAILKP